MSLASKNGKKVEVRGSSVPQYVKDMSYLIKELASTDDSGWEVHERGGQFVGRNQNLHPPKKN